MDVKDTLIKNWLTFLSDSTKAREKLTSQFQKALSRLDLVVEEQRQVTAFCLKKILNLSDGDVVKLNADGSYEILRKEGNNE